VIQGRSPGPFVGSLDHTERHPTDVTADRSTAPIRASEGALRMWRCELSSCHVRRGGAPRSEHCYGRAYPAPAFAALSTIDRRRPDRSRGRRAAWRAPSSYLVRVLAAVGTLAALPVAAVFVEGLAAATSCWPPFARGRPWSRRGCEVTTPGCRPPERRGDVTAGYRAPPEPATVPDGACGPKHAEHVGGELGACIQPSVPDAPVHRPSSGDARRCTCPERRAPESPAPGAFRLTPLRVQTQKCSWADSGRVCDSQRSRGR
jgi:hypothetical protein